MQRADDHIIRGSSRQVGGFYAPLTRVSGKRVVTPLIMEAIYDHLSEKPGLYPYEIMSFSMG